MSCKTIICRLTSKKIYVVYEKLFVVSKFSINYMSYKKNCMSFHIMRHINTGVIFRCHAKRRKSSKRNYYIISPRVIIKAIIITKSFWALTPHSGREHLMFSNPTPSEPCLSPAAAPRWWATTCHVVGSHSTLAWHLHLAACHPSLLCHNWDLDHLCSNFFQQCTTMILFHCCWITETRSLNPYMCFYLFLVYLCFSDEIVFSFESLFSFWKQWLKADRLPVRYNLPD